MNVDQSLQSSMQDHIKIAESKFSEDADRKVLEEFVLFTFAGMGLAEQVRDGSEPIWVKTDLLKGLEAPKDPSCEPQMDESVRSVLDDIIETSFNEILRIKSGQSPSWLCSNSNLQ
jgi:hypothetical protein